MEQEKTQSGMEIKEKPVETMVPLGLVQEHLNRSTERLKENTVALVEMGVIVRNLENKITHLIEILSKQ